MFRSYKIELRPNNLLNYQPSPKIKGGCKADEVELLRPSVFMHKANSFDVVNNITTNTGALNTANV